MERTFLTGLMALLFAAAPMGCNGATGNNGNTNGTDTTPDDSGDPGNDVTYMVTLHASIDNVVITDNPPAVCLHETEGETGEEAVLATGTTTEVQIPVDVPKTGETVRPWVGPSSAEKTADGYRIYERDGFHYIHEIADFLVDEDCEDTVNLNVMPAVENVQYSCVDEQYWNSSGALAGSTEVTRTFLAKEGKYFYDPDDETISDGLGANEMLMTSGSKLMVHNTTSGDYDTEEDSFVDEDGFYLHIDNGDLTVYLTCVLQ